MQGAKNYRASAEVLFAQFGKADVTHDPTYYLYFHSIELVLKAFLRAKGLNLDTFRHHLLTKLYAECKAQGLMIPDVDKHEPTNVVSLMEAGNQYQGFRYFNSESISIPALPWLSEFLPKLIAAVDVEVGRAVVSKGVTGNVSKLTITVSKPVEQSPNNKPPQKKAIP
jgi:hypothetical protein